MTRHWEDTNSLLRDISAPPHKPYNFLRDLTLAELERLDDILEYHRILDDGRASTNRKDLVNGYEAPKKTTCRFPECGIDFPTIEARNKHEAGIHKVRLRERR